MPLAGRLDTLEESEGSLIDPLNCVQVVIPVTFPGDISLNLNCVTIVSCCSSESSRGSSLSFSPSVSTSNSCSQNEETRPPFDPIHEVSEDFGDIEQILRESQSETTSLRDDYTECDLDLDDVDFDEFEDGTAQVTSTTSSGLTNIYTTHPHSLQSEDEEEDILLHNPNPVPCLHCQG